jgi:hypothetical protein
MGAAAFELTDEIDQAVHVAGEEAPANARMGQTVESIVVYVAPEGHLLSNGRAVLVLQKQRRIVGSFIYA